MNKTQKNRMTKITIEKEAIKKTCPICKKEFVCAFKKRIYCNDKCRQEGRSEREKLKRKSKFGSGICRACGKSYIRWNMGQKYCSNECVGKANEKKVESRKCPMCKKVFTPTEKQRNQKYCSTTCARKVLTKKRKGKEKECPVCRKVFYVPPGRMKKNKLNFCSVICQRRYYTGKSRITNWDTRKGKAKTIRAFDARWRTKALEKADNKCEYCGSTENLNAHHIIGRRNYSTRWYIPNSCILCVKHHRYSADFSAHENPLEFVEWIKAERGEEWYKDLIKRKNDLWHDWKARADDIRKHLYGKN